MKMIQILFMVGTVFGLVSTTHAQNCTDGEYYKSIRQFPNGSVQIEEPGIYAAGALVDYFSYTSDNTALCGLLGFNRSIGDQAMEARNKSETCLRINNLGEFITSGECDRTYKYLFCSRD